MWISKITLDNFKSYGSAVFEFPEPKGDKNLVIIGGENGHGKTTLLEAIYLCLYDADAIGHLSRAGLGSDKINYPDYMNNALHKDALFSRGSYTMTLSIEFMSRTIKGDKQGVKIKRLWHYNRERELMIEDREKSIYRYEGASFGLPLDDEEGEAYLQTHAMPSDYAPFFFFDGEKITKAVDKGVAAKTWLMEALSGLTGVTLLSSVSQELKHYRQQFSQAERSSQKQEKLAKLQDDELAKKSEIMSIQRKFNETDEHYQKWSAKQESLLTKLGSGQDIKTSEELLCAKQAYEIEIEQYETNIKNAIVGLPLSFLPRKQLATLMDKLNKENNRLHHELGKDQIEDKVDEFWQAFVESEQVKNALGTMSNVILNDEALKSAVRQCWHSLFYPLPENCASKTTHNYLTPTIYSHINNDYGGLIKCSCDDLSAVLKNIEVVKERQFTIERQLVQNKESGRDQLTEELRQASSQCEELNSERNRLSNILKEKMQALEKIEREIDDITSEISDSNPQVVRARRVEKVRALIDELSKALIVKKMGNLEVLASTIHRQIAHDQRIDAIKIGDEQLDLYSYDQKAVDITTLSAGQAQILVMALIYALAKATNYNTPFVIDTPLARLDISHRNNLFDYWQSLSQQVILLSQDAEITTDVYEKLQPYVAKTYLIKAESSRFGGAISKVIEHQYFDKGR